MTLTDLLFMLAEFVPSARIAERAQCAAGGARGTIATPGIPLTKDRTAERFTAVR